MCNKFVAISIVNLCAVIFQLYYAAQNKELAKASFKKAAEGIPDYAAPMFYLA